MAHTITKVVAGVAALGALALGGSALAGAATNGTATGATGTQSAPHGAAQGRPPQGGPHVGANGRQEQALTGDAAAKVKAAALAKVPGGTVERVETDVDHGSPYEAHVRRSDGTELEVLVNGDFEVTAVNAMQAPPQGQAPQRPQTP